MGKNKPLYGISKNGIPFVKVGKFDKILLVFTGGPGDNLPKGANFKFMIKNLSEFLKEYMIVFVSRRSGLSENYTTKNFSEDYAEFINQEFNGKVSVILGISFGGMIAQHFAADYPDLFDHLIIAMAAHRMSEEGKALDNEYAENLSKGNIRAAYALIANMMYPEGIIRSILKILLWIIGVFVRKPTNDTFSKDVIIEAKAEIEHNALDSLKRINKSVLIICGDEDFYFPYKYVEEMADIIEENKVIFYIGKGHNIISDERFQKDIKDYIEKHSS